MYGIFTYIWLFLMVNVGEYTIPMDPSWGMIVQTPRYREAAEAYLDLTIGKADGPWWAMGLKQKPRLCCRFFLEIGFLLTPTSAFGSKRSCKFQIGFYSGGISTHVPCVVDNVYRHNSVQSIKSSITPIKSIFASSLFAKHIWSDFFPYFIPIYFSNQKN